MIKKLSMLILICGLGSSCQTDATQVVVYGTVVDKTTKEPITGLEITIENWAYNNSVDQSYTVHKVYKVITNAEGKYEQFIGQSHLIQLEITNSKYQPISYNLYASKGKNKKNFKLSLARTN